MAKHKIKAVINKDLTKERPNYDELYYKGLIGLVFSVYGMIGYNSVMKTNYSNDIFRGAVTIGFLVGFIPLNMFSNIFAKEKIRSLVKKS